ncbi:RNA polymerase subunit sigma-70 [bacterium]|nr:MAG: RNA polymerase subunit sigma-70 [bacterium]
MDPSPHRPDAEPEEDRSAVRSDATVILQELAAGESGAFDRLFAVVYDEMRGMAQAYLSRERVDHTLQPTALVHEAYLKMVDQDRADWKSRAHFRAVAAQVMRRLLVDHERRRARRKRGGDQRKLPLDDELQELLGREDREVLTILDLDRALVALEKHSREMALLVEMRFFGGMSIEEIATTLEVTERTVWRYWEQARTWLNRRLEAD